jgi:hypothetical protein
MSSLSYNKGPDDESGPCSPAKYFKLICVADAFIECYNFVVVFCSEGFY